MPLLDDITRDENTHRNYSSTLHKLSVVAKVLITAASVFAGVSGFGEFLGHRIVAAIALVPGVIQGLAAGLKWDQKSGWHHGYAERLEHLRHRLEGGANPGDIETELNNLRGQMNASFPD
jgi:hypothetical protein